MLWFAGEELLNKVIIFVFFTQKKYSCSFVKLRLNHWCHIDCFTNVLTAFLGLGTFQLHCCQCRVRKLSDFIKKYLNLCSENERRSYGFGKTWGCVINDRIVIFGWTIPLMTHSHVNFLQRKEDRKCIYVRQMYSSTPLFSWKKKRVVVVVSCFLSI